MKTLRCVPPESRRGRSTAVISAVFLLSLWMAGLGMPDAPLAAGKSVGGPFTMTNHTGKTVTDRDFRGRFMLIYFGYTYCPDVCPTGLFDMSEALDMLGDDADLVQPLFVTIDPQRDTPKVMAEYVALYHPRLIGLTGSAEETERLARAYHVYYSEYVDHDLSGYQLDHTANIYFMGPDGQYLTFFPYAHPPNLMAEEMKSLIDRFRTDGFVRHGHEASGGYL